MKIWPSLAARISLEGEMAFAFLGLEIAGGEQAAEPAIGRAVGRIGQHFEAVDGDQPRADEELDGSRLRASS